MAEAALPEVRAAVAESWVELIPAADIWTPEQRRAAERITDVALRCLVSVFAQGDLDEESWLRIRQETADGRVTSAEEVAELLRTIRLVGVERLLTILQAEAALTTAERWALQQEALTYCEEIQGRRGQIDSSAVDALFASLEAAGPDLA